MQTHHYEGRMTALRQASKHYVKGPNGNPHCHDELAFALEGFTRDQVCAALLLSMGLERNPYDHLNPGQQSLNLRNMARRRIRAGEITMEPIYAILKITERAFHVNDPNQNHHG